MRPVNPVGGGQNDDSRDVAGGGTNIPVGKLVYQTGYRGQANGAFQVDNGALKKIGLNKNGLKSFGSKRVGLKNGEL